MGNSESITIPINVTVGHTVTVGLNLSAGTGYTWVLSTLPDCLNLMDVSADRAAEAGGVTHESFTFVAVKAGHGTLQMRLIRPWEPNEEADIRIYQVIASEAPAAAKALTSTMGAGNFLPPLQHTSVMDPCPLYAYPSHCHTHPPILKYGYPVNLKYGYPLPEPLYGYPVPELKSSVGEAAGPITTAHSLTKCVVKYGAPYSPGQAGPGDCRLMYGVPIDHTGVKK